MSAVFAFGPFASGWMLLWGLAAAIPVAIHLWNQRQRRETDWAAMQFLMAAVQRHSRRIRLEHWCLLALRVALLFVFALALADLRYGGLPVGTSVSAARKHTILVLDGSYSMAAETGGESSFRRAQDAALEVLRRSAQGDGFTLVLMSDRPRTIIQEVAFDPADVAEQVAALAVEDSVSSLAATLDEVAGLLRRARERHPWIAEQRVCFFSDLTRVTWSEAESAPIAARLDELARLARLTFVEVGDEVPANTTVAGLESAAAWVTPAEPTPLAVTLRGFGNRPQRTQLRLLVDGRRVAEEEVEVPAGAEVTRTFEHRFTAAGAHIIEAQIADDALRPDNHRWLSLVVPQRVRVLCVEGQVGGAAHLALALAPDPQRGTIAPTVAGESALVELDLHQFAAVFLCNVGRFGSREATLLQDYVRQGGGLIVALGDRVQPESYNRELAGESPPTLLPARLVAPVGGQTQHFDPLDYRHPIVAAFQGHERAGLLTAPVWRYFDLEPVGGQTEAVLGFSDGDPALMASRFGRGRCLLLATDISSGARELADPQGPWSALSTWPSFPPLVHEMLRYAVRGGDSRRNVLVGEILAGTLPDRAPLASWTLDGPRGSSHLLEADNGQRPPRFAFAGTRRSGIYRLESDERGDPDSRQRFAVNVDPREGELMRIDPGLLPHQLVPLERLERAPAEGGAAGSRQPLFRVCLAVVALLMLVETGSAWWFAGRGA